MADSNNTYINRYSSKLENFIRNNYELISRYDIMEDVPLIEDCMDEICHYYSTLLSMGKVSDFNSTLFYMINRSLQYGVSILDSFESVFANNIEIDDPDSTLQIYFREVNKIYNDNDNDFNIEYCEENRNKLIEMNLKTVISIAKRYQGLGLSLQELISAGNLGLIISFDKYDPNRANLKDNIISSINELPTSFSFNALCDAIKKYLEYGDVKNKFVKRFNNKTSKYSKKDAIEWVNHNINNAKFNSVATMWIRAYILIEIDNYSRVVKKPKAEIYKDRQETGSYKKEKIVVIDAPISDDNDTPLSDIFCIEDEDSKYTASDVSDAYDCYKNGLRLLLDGVKTRDRSIFLRKFGIGLPRPLEPKEIAQQEGLSIARVSQIFQNVIKQMQLNQIKFNVDPNILFEAVKKMQ